MHGAAILFKPRPGNSFLVTSPSHLNSLPYMYQGSQLTTHTSRYWKTVTALVFSNDQQDFPYMYLIMKNAF